VDIYSRKLNSRLGLTTPQLLCLHALAEEKDMTLSDLAKAVNLGGSTVNGIVDRLEAKNYVKRERSTQDRRKVYLIMTDLGKSAAKEAPSLLQDKLSSALANLSDLEQLAITQSLERVVELMEVEEVDASPHLMASTEIEDSTKA
jgi:DNA-binding MarR family transcriptional regulator